MDDFVLDPKLAEVLFKSKFTIKADDSHTRKNATERQADEIESALVDASYKKIEQMKTSPQKIAVLYGNPRSPYMRMDPYFMEPPEDEEARDALSKFIAIIEANLRDLVLVPGDCCFIDNYRVVHGRRSFTANFDGKDRWLKRVNIVRDLRKSSDSRRTPSSRVIY